MTLIVAVDSVGIHFFPNNSSCGLTGYILVVIISYHHIYADFVML